LPVKKLQNLRKESEAAEEAILRQLHELVAQWKAQALNSLVIEKAIEYVRTSPVTHTSNKWTTNETGMHIMSNMVYKMSYFVAEEAAYGNPQQASAWVLTWNIYTNSPKYGGEMKVAGLYRRRFVDKGAFDKYLEGRIADYSFLFNEISPPVPPELASSFTVNGKLLPGYTLLGKEGNF
jgi:hypothetical protein